jgi:hypothetical protein
VQLVLVGLTHKSKEGEIRILNLLFKKLHFSHQKFAKVILDGIVKKKKLESLATTLVLNLNNYSNQHITYAFSQISRCADQQRYLATEKSGTLHHQEAMRLTKETSQTVKALTLHSTLEKIIFKKFALGFRSIEFIARLSWETEKNQLDRESIGQMGESVGVMLKSRVIKFFENGLEFIGQREKGLARLEAVFSEKMKYHWQGVVSGGWLRGENRFLFEKVILGRFTKNLREKFTKFTRQTYKVSDERGTEQNLILERSRVVEMFAKKINLFFTKTLTGSKKIVFQRLKNN